MAEQGIIADDRGRGGLQLLISAGPARIVADQPLESGGLDLGPTPHELVAAALAACTAQTIRLYVQRKGWTVGAVRVEVTHAKDETQTPMESFSVSVTLPAGLTEEQVTRIMAVGGNCPVHRLLVNGARITMTAPVTDAAPAA